MPELNVLEITDDDVEAVVSLWRRAGLVRPWNDPVRDVAFARNSGHAALLVGREPEAEAIVASVMVGHDGHRG
ncbi:MAG: GNAT family N-acetyltransferase, partial [Hyphomicrobiales bacterium]|nr:GNAT family N-acetyltransferase [Hyphomicrobiales bacterium]